MSQEPATGDQLNPWLPFSSTWTQVSEHMTRSFLEANRAAAAAFGLPADRNGDSAAMETPLLGMAYREPEWEFEGGEASADELSIGSVVRFSKHITETDVQDFARASGDTNRLHLDESFAESSRFGDRIVHGTLVSGLISAALARLPLLTIYLSQDVQFLQPVEIGERVTAVCEVVEDLGDRKYRLTTKVYDSDDELVIDGEAIVLIDDLPSNDE